MQGPCGQQRLNRVGFAPNVDVIPRGMTTTEVARYLGFQNVQTFRSKLPQLRKLGFPNKIVGLHRYDRTAIDRWLDEQSGLQESLPLAAAERALEKWLPS